MAVVLQRNEGRADGDAVEAGLSCANVGKGNHKWSLPFPTDLSQDLADASILMQHRSYRQHRLFPVICRFAMRSYNTTSTAALRFKQ